MRSGWFRSSACRDRRGGAIASATALAAALALTVAACGGGGSGTRAGDRSDAAVRTTSHGRSVAAAGTRTGARSTAGAPAHARPAVTPARGAYRGAVPILMYHVIHPPPAGTPYPELWVAPRRFAEEMHALHDQGYRAVTLGQVLDAWHGGPGLPARPVVVSFDDGYLSQYRDAGTTLRDLGWPGVLNLEVKNLGLAGGLTRREVRAMARDGWEVDAHTITHPDLTTLDAAGLRREVAGSRSILHARLGLPIDFFCYPAGRFDATAEAAVRDAGYRGATTTQPGAAQPGGDPYALPRVRVNGGDTSVSLLSRLRSLG